MGAAYLAGLAVGYRADTWEIRRNWAIERTFTPPDSRCRQSQSGHGLKKAVRCTEGWAKD